MIQIQKHHITKNVEKKFQFPEYLISNFSMKLDPIILIKSHSYYCLTISFSFIEEIGIIEENEYIEYLDTFVGKINAGINEIIILKKEVVTVKLNQIIFKDKKYKASATILHIPTAHIIRNKKEVQSIGDKYINIIKTALQVAGDEGITMSTLTPITQRLTPFDRHNMMDFLIADQLVRVEEIKKHSRIEKRYYWITHE